MTAERIAEDITTPVSPDGRRARAYLLVEHTPGRTTLDGRYPSGVGGRTLVRVAFSLDGRDHVVVGPAFERVTDAIELADLLNGETPRSRADVPTVLGAVVERGIQPETGEPDRAARGRVVTPGRAAGSVTTANPRPRVAENSFSVSTRQRRSVHSTSDGAEGRDLAVSPG